MKTNLIAGKIPVTKLGFGAWALGGGAYGDVPERDAYDALDSYLSSGGNFIDTAEGYGYCEELLGRYMQERNNKNNVVIATKTASGGEAETVCELEKKVDKALGKLNRDYIDLFYLHSPPDDDQTIADALGTLQLLKQKGKILAVGASIKGVDVTDDTVSLSKKYIDSKQTDALQLVYSVVRQKNAEIFDYAATNNVAIIGRTCLESGFLTGKFPVDTVFNDGDHRARWNAKIREMLTEVANLNKFVLEKEYDTSLLSFALRFAMTPDAVTTTIVGAKNQRQYDAIFESYNNGNLSKDVYNYFTSTYGDKTNGFNTK